MLSIILPTYNEKDNLPVLIEKINDACRKSGIKYEIIVVDDNSPDGTGRLADSLSRHNSRIKVIHRRGKLGLGSAVMDGARTSRGEYICIMDADLQHDPEDIPKLYSAVKHSNIVIGSRYVKGGRNELGTIRTAISLGASLLARLILGISVKDPESGFAVIKKSVFENAGLNPRGFKINLELMYKSGEKVKEVPITLKKRIHGETKLGMNEIVNYLILLMRLRSFKSKRQA